jgi:hypothetical protein
LELRSSSVTEGGAAKEKYDNKDNNQPNAVIAKESTFAAHNLNPPKMT